MERIVPLETGGWGPKRKGSKRQKMECMKQKVDIFLV